ARRNPRYQQGRAQTSSQGSSLGHAQKRARATQRGPPGAAAGVAASKQRAAVRASEPRPSGCSPLVAFLCAYLLPLCEA
nr:hypothetical protein [Tanacetum cinerariifolium]